MMKAFSLGLPWAVSLWGLRELLVPGGRPQVVRPSVRVPPKGAAEFRPIA